MLGDTSIESAHSRNTAKSSALFGIVLVIATAGLIYELAIATVASYLLGDTVTQFSLVIGVYLSALGLGAYLSRYIDRDLTTTFVRVEFATALIGGLSVIGLELSFSFGAPFRVLLLLAVLVVGVLVGLELPLLMRILERRMTFRDLIARALGFDYIGALLGSLGFSLWLLPQFGLAQTALVCGLLNASVGLLSTWLLEGQSPTESRSLRRLRWLGLVLMAGLGIVLWMAEPLTRLGERQLFGDIVRAVQSPYQRILLTRRKGNLDLFLNGRLQFSSSDEKRYHEALVHPVLAAATPARRGFVGGGGDGLALREILKWQTVQSVTLVDIDPAITRLAATQPQLLRLNQRSMLNERVHVVNADAMIYLASTPATYDVILLDFPDPTQLALGKLYTTRFYSIVRDHLNVTGALGVQCTSPLLTRQSFWSIISTLEAVGLNVIPYRTFIPSFGDWGFALARREPFEFPHQLPSIATTTLDRDTLLELPKLPSDTQRVPAKINTLNNQALVAVYLRESARFE
jgi:spermidine synthase